jgi:sulfoxide reductase catalytic subunit YedY
MASTDPDIDGRRLAREVTPESVYLNRRALLRAGIVAASAAVTGVAYRWLNQPGSGAVNTPKLAGLVASRSTAGFRTYEPTTPLESVTNYNNFYEFSTDKESVARVSKGFVARPWTVEVDGLVGKPKTFDLDEILKLSAPEERIYRMRCVEGWSMVVPWAGFSLSVLLDAVQPKSDAKYVAFQTLKDPDRFPGQKDNVLDWPYVEGLRMDEAMHTLTLLTSGLYGQELPAQNGAPLRLITPWKYGFKGVKSIVKITLTNNEPPTTWNLANAGEYGFYANVNPTVDHPRWSQATEERLDAGGRRRIPTQMFNGYADQVASMYAGMDLRKNY